MTCVGLLSSHENGGSGHMDGDTWLECWVKVCEHPKLFNCVVTFAKVPSFILHAMC